MLRSSLQEPPRDGRMNAVGKFGRFKSEAPQDVREPLARKDPALDRFLDIWQRVECFPWDETPDLFNRAVAAVGDFKCAPDDVRRFTLVVKAYAATEERLRFKAGLLLSALMNSSEGDGFMIPLKELAIPLDYIGEKCSKHILIDGDAGGHIGSGMQGGRLVVDGNVGEFVGGYSSGCDILVKGNAGEYAGSSFSGRNLIIKGNAGDNAGNSMKEGMLRIDGDAGASLGNWMKGGTVYLRGNAGANVGEWMQGGMIHVDGEIESLGNVKGGKIYYKGKLIVDKPDVKK